MSFFKYKNVVMSALLALGSSYAFADSCSSLSIVEMITAKSLIEEAQSANKPVVVDCVECERSNLSGTIKMKMTPAQFKGGSPVYAITDSSNVPLDILNIWVDGSNLGRLVERQKSSQDFVQRANEYMNDNHLTDFDSSCSDIVADSRTPATLAELAPQKQAAAESRRTNAPGGAPDIPSTGGRSNH